MRGQVRETYLPSVFNRFRDDFDNKLKSIKSLPFEY